MFLMASNNNEETNKKQETPAPVTGNNVAKEVEKKINKPEKTSGKPEKSPGKFDTKAVKLYVLPGLGLLIIIICTLVLLQHYNVINLYSLFNIGNGKTNQTSVANDNKVNIESDKNQTAGDEQTGQTAIPTNPDGKRFGMAHDDKSTEPANTQSTSQKPLPLAQDKITSGTQTQNKPPVPTETPAPSKPETAESVVPTKPSNIEKPLPATSPTPAVSQKPPAPSKPPTQAKPQTSPIPEPRLPRLPVEPSFVMKPSTVQSQPNRSVIPDNFKDIPSYNLPEKLPLESNQDEIWNKAIHPLSDK